jgi:hypothetical protein
MTKSIRSSKATTATFVWRGITCRVRHTPKYFNDSDHIELNVVSPKGATLPITETGFRSEFVTALVLSGYGGAAAYMTALLEREANTKRWIKRDADLRQLKLFE